VYALSGGARGGNASACLDLPGEKCYHARKETAGGANYYSREFINIERNKKTSEGVFHSAYACLGIIDEARTVLILNSTSVIR
jgi:hypothetical protein